MIKNNIIKILRNSNLLKVKENYKVFLNFTTISIYKSPSFFFAKKVSDKKGQLKQEKQQIEKEYDGLGEEDLKEKYSERAQSIYKKMQEKYAEIQVMKQNPKILDTLPIINQGTRYKLSEVATITLRGANLLVVTPFDDNMKDAIHKGIESSKMDIQIISEGNTLLITLGNIPNDVKKDLHAAINKIYNHSKESMKETRHNFLAEIKKLEKILGKDEAKRMEKGILDLVDKINKQIETLHKKKDEEIKSC